MKRKIIAGNWKMFTSIAEATVLTKVVSRRAEDFNHLDVILCPPFLWLTYLREELATRPNNLYLGAQNCAWKEEGAFTGEVSPKMLKNLVEYVIIGHSERRRIFKEDDAMIGDKIQSALENKLKPIICIGELENKSGDKVDKQIITQFRHALDAISEKQLENVIFAYEPLWAIGTGKAASPLYASTVIANLRLEIEKRYGRDLAHSVDFLYGGSVVSQNIGDYLEYENIDGALVGGASLVGREFIKICSIASGEN